MAVFITAFVTLIISLDVVHAQDLSDHCGAEPIVKGARQPSCLLQREKDVAMRMSSGAISEIPTDKHDKTDVEITTGTDKGEAPFDELVEEPPSKKKVEKAETSFAEKASAWKDDEQSTAKGEKSEEQADPAEEVMISSYKPPAEKGVSAIPTWRIWALSIIAVLAVVGGAGFMLNKKDASAPADVPEDAAAPESPEGAKSKAMTAEDYESLLRLLVQKASQKVGPHLAKGQALRGILEQHVRAFPQKAKTLVLNELNGVAAKILQAVDAEEAMLLLDWNAAITANFPPISVLLAGILSPPLLQIALVNHVAQIFLFFLPVAILCVWAIFVDQDTVCAIPTIHAWVRFTAVLTVAIVLARAALVFEIRSGKAMLKEKAKEMQKRLSKVDHDSYGNEMKEVFICHSVLLQEALLVEDGIRRSIWRYLVGGGSLLLMFGTVWNAVLVFGWTFVPGTVAFHASAAKSAGEDYCGAWATVLAARIFCVCGVLFFFVNVVSVVQWLSDLMLHAPGYSKMILGAAAKADSGMLDLPVVQTLVKAFLLRGSSETATSQLAVTLQEKALLEEEAADLEKSLAELKQKIVDKDTFAEKLRERVPQQDNELQASIDHLEKEGLIDTEKWKETGMALADAAAAKAAATDAEALVTDQLEALVARIRGTVDELSQSETGQSLIAASRDLSSQAQLKAAKLKKQLKDAEAEIEASAPESLERLGTSSSAIFSRLRGKHS